MRKSLRSCRCIILVERLLRHNPVLDVMGEGIDWSEEYRTLTPHQMASGLSKLARRIDMRWLKKNKRGPKERFPKPKAEKNKPHFSTWRVLNTAT